MRKPLVKFFIGGKSVPPPRNWEELKVIGNFEGLSNSSQIESDRFDLILEAAREVIDYVGSGNITEGLDFNTEISNQDGSLDVIDGFIDFTKDFEITNPQQVKASISLQNSIEELKDRMEGVTVDLIEINGGFSSSDYTKINYVVEKETTILEIAILTVTIYLMAKELAEQIYRVSTAVTDAAAVFSAGFTGSVGSAILTVGRAVAEIAYAAFIAVQIVNLTKELLGLLISPTYDGLCISYRTLIEKSFNYLGYEFESSISDLDNFYYLPSNQDDIEKGLPRITDFGYTVSDIYELMSQTFYAKGQIIGNVLHFEPNNSDFWLKESSLVINDISFEDAERKKFNIDDANNVYFINYQTDITDTWTIKNYTGTSYEVTLSPKTITDIRKTMIKGFDQTAIPLSLGNRKDSLSLLENTISAFVDSANVILKIFGADVKNPIEQRIGLLKVSDNKFNNPKSLYLQGGKLPFNHRSKISAKYLWDNYHNEKSFVENNFGGQKLVFDNIEIPFTFREYLKIVNFNKITDWEGRDGEVTSLEWSFDKDTALVSFNVKEIYTKNLKETKIEA